MQDLADMGLFQNYSEEYHIPKKRAWTAHYWKLNKYLVFTIVDRLKEMEKKEQESSMLEENLEETYAGVFASMNLEQR